MADLSANVQAAVLQVISRPADFDPKAHPCVRHDLQGGCPDRLLAHVKLHYRELKRGPGPNQNGGRIRSGYPGTVPVHQNGFLPFLTLHLRRKAIINLDALRCRLVRLSGSVVMADGGGWLKISTEGFASFNQSRPPGHLVKELVQNALDAVGDAGGTVSLDYRHDGHIFHVDCRDSGNGIHDLSAMRVVYLTFKTDSHLKRGRFGRGFKEILSVAQSATVTSGSEAIQFIVEDGKQVTRTSPNPKPIKGSHVAMSFDWAAETASAFDSYFSRFLVPKNVTLLLNGRAVKRRPVRHSIEAQLATEIYNAESHSWQKPRRKTTIELVNTRGDEEPFIYEMGIPVALAEWTVPFHANILQRVPMNPNRDALASGYAKRIHSACLPTLLPELDSEAITADWVGAAGTEVAPEVQQEIVVKAFGENAVRSVPSMGKRDFDDDAHRIGGSVVKTAQMSGGFREMAKAHLPTTKEAVTREESRVASEIAANRFTAAEIQDRSDRRHAWIEKRGGKLRVDRCLSFAVWFCQKLVDSTSERQKPVTGALALGNDPTYLHMHVGRFLAHWSSDNRVTLALECDCFWNEPLGAKSLAILIHEGAHARNMHHGKSFHEEVERLGGIAAEIMFRHAAEIRRKWPDLVGNTVLSPILKGAKKARFFRGLFRV